MNQRSRGSVVLVRCAILCALTFCATCLSVPTPGFGNVNLGDAVLLLGTSMPIGPQTIVACAVGAGLADLISGYAIYIPCTLLVKAGMGYVMWMMQARKQKRSVFHFALVALCAELVMVLGYFVYESFFLKFGWAALGNIPFNLVQASVNIILAAALLPLLWRTKWFS